MTQTVSSSNLPPEIFQKLAANLSPEEYHKIMSAMAVEETDAEIYSKLEEKYTYLHGVGITKTEVFDLYKIHATTIDRWVEKRWVRRIKSGRGQGIQTTYDQGDIAVLFELNNIRKGNSPKPGPFKGGWTPPERW